MIAIGAVPYTNGAPLVYGLEKEPGVRLIRAVPSKLARMLQAKEIDVGLVSSAACFLNPSLEIVPGISISSIGPARSVKIFYKHRLEEAKKVALDTSSLTSVLLARVILRERFEIFPEFVNMPPDVDNMLEVCDAAVVIGDTTMRVPEGRWQYLDLGQAWHELTGLPFTYAVWAANPDAPKEIVGTLMRAKEQGLSNLAQISRLEAERLGLSYEECYEYLSSLMNYDLSPDHILGIELFRQKAVSYGLVAQPGRIRLFGNSTIR